MIWASEDGTAVMDVDFAEGMEITFRAASGPVEVAFKKEVDFPWEGGFGATGSFSDGFDKSVFFCEPVDDETGFCEGRLADDEASVLEVLGHFFRVENREARIETILWGRWFGLGGVLGA